jgi:hypothetical protein
MTHAFGRPAAAAAALSLLVSGLSGCGLLDGSSRIEEALEYLPEQARTITFVDRTAIAERIGDDGDAAATAEEGYGTELTRWVVVMQEAAFSDFDVEWEATATGADVGLVRAWKLTEDVDFDEVAADLEDAGYERSGSGDATTFDIELSAADASGTYGGRYPAFLSSLALVPDERLVLTGRVDLAVDVAGDDEDSLADSGSFDDLLALAADDDALEFAGLTLDPSCGAGGRLSPEQVAQQSEGLSHPDRGMALFADPDEGVRAVRLFGEESDPEQDAEGLEDHLAESAAATGFEVEMDVEADGDAVIATADFDDRLQLVRAWSRVEGPFACPPGR